jgi:hypothetical protein
MDRRGLFKALIGGGAVASVPPVAAHSATLDIEKDHWVQDRSGKWWWMCWTGWKSSYNSREMACQHIALPVAFDGGKLIDRRRPMLYSSYPGVCTTFNEGDCFNVCVQQEQMKLTPEWPNFNSNPKDLSKAEIWSYRRLREYIEKDVWFNWDGSPYSASSDRPAELSRKIEAV